MFVVCCSLLVVCRLSFGVVFGVGCVVSVCVCLLIVFVGLSLMVYVCDRCALLVVCCWLFVVCRWLNADCCWCVCSLFVVRRLLCFVR